MINRFKQVTLEIYRGSAPEPKDVIWLHENFNINKIVSLDEESGEVIDKICKRLNIKQVKIYLDFSLSSLLNLLSYDLKNLLEVGGPTFVHCHEGKDRTGLLIALYKCKYLNMNPEDAIKEAESLGFGIGVDPKVTELYKKIIRSTKENQDSNNADIVSNERDYKSDHRNSFLQEADRSSFAPYQSGTKQAPMDFVYNSVNEQYSTRKNYKTKNDDKYINTLPTYVTPQIGLRDPSAGIGGAGPSENFGAFISD